MNRIDKLFQDKQKEVLSVYMIAGYPQLEDTIPVIRSLESAGVDMIEIGMPFSDPLADGPVIQACSSRALANGMSLKVLFEQLEQIREITDLPLILMGYLNTVLQYDMGKFLSDCRKTGIDGVILPDLPLDEYRDHYRSVFTENGIHLIMLISPETTDERIKLIASNSGGFLYMVSASSTTGAKNELSEDQLNYFSRISNMQLPLPKLIGFGISNEKTFRQACMYANGAIIGSAFLKSVEAVSDSDLLDEKIKAFIKTIRPAEGG